MPLELPKPTQKNKRSASSKRAAAGKRKEDSQKVTMMGRTSAGGSREVQNASSARGSSFTGSGPKRSSFPKNGSFHDIDRSADPDYQISTPEKYYDRQKLTDYINSLYKIDIEKRVSLWDYLINCSTTAMPVKNQV
jgi:hypothetical protein